MTSEDRAFLDRLSLRLLNKPLDAEWLVTSVHHHGGHDTEDLSNVELVALLEGRYTGDWWKPAFAFSEMLAYFAAIRHVHEPVTNEHVVTWAYAVLALADALEQGASDWDLQLDVFIESYLAVKERLDAEDAVWMMRRAFCRSMSARVLPVNGG